MGLNLLKHGSGVHAFSPKTPRIPGKYDEDDDDGLDVDVYMAYRNRRKTPLKRKKTKKRWNRFKWTLLFTNLLVGNLLTNFELKYPPSRLPASHS